jgi:predicted DCC family thiol-disulfide oxidoreductase YuxK
VLFDGWCPLCVRAVRFLIRTDRKALFLLASLESEPARGLLDTCQADPEDRLAARTGATVALVDRGRLYVRSDAALRIAARLPFPWRFLVLLRVVPRGLRDRAYVAIARRRHEVWGRLDSCHVPEQADRERFL